MTLVIINTEARNIRKTFELARNLATLNYPFSSAVGFKIYLFVAR